MSKKKKPDIRKHNVNFMENTSYNLMTLEDYFYRLKRIALLQFEWTNLPPTMNEHFLEYCFFEDGYAGIFYSKDYGLVNSMVSFNGQVNQYMLPSKLNLYSVGNIWNESRNLFIEKNNDSIEKEAVFAMNNFELIPTSKTLNLFAHRLAKAERNLDLNLNALKTPLILTCDDENQALTLQNLWFKYDGNSPILIGNSKIINSDSIKAIKTDAPNLLEDLKNYKMSIWNEALQFLGINSIDYEKRERLLTDEVNSNNEITNLNLQTFLTPRKLAAKQINEMMGFTTPDKMIDVRVRSDLHNIIKSVMSSTSDLKDDNEVEEADNI